MATKVTNTKDKKVTTKAKSSGKAKAPSNWSDEKKKAWANAKMHEPKWD